MANHASARKRHRQNIKRRARNRFAKATIRTKVKDSLKAAEAGKTDEAEKFAKEATSLLDKAVVHGVLHRNSASRTISRLHSKLGKA